jgi:hypothetical protein
MVTVTAFHARSFSTSETLAILPPEPSRTGEGLNSNEREGRTVACRKTSLQAAVDQCSELAADNRRSGRSAHWVKVKNPKAPRLNVRPKRIGAAEID